MKKGVLTTFLVISCTVVMSHSIAWANNLAITNLTMEDRDQTNRTVVVQFDISWNNSWRNSTNHDAVWVFLKLNDSTVDTIWYHGALKTSGLDPANTSPGSNNDVEVFVPSDVMGAFIRRRVTGSGSVNSKKVKLVLDIAATATNAGISIANTDTIQVKAFGIEMVYIPEGPFYAGDTGSSQGFTGNSGSAPWYITSEGQIQTSASFTAPYYYTNTGSSAHPSEYFTAAKFTIPAAFPKGYQAFYCMKYEITEGQWIDFINTLTTTQSQARDITSPTTSSSGGKGFDTPINRNTISQSSTTAAASTTRTDRAMSYLSWMDLCAYLDWAALRPMSELEFEKIARGPLDYVAREYAWGDTSITSATTFAYSTEDGKEIFSTTGANTVYNVSANYTSGDGGTGPARAGIFATDSSSRSTSGAGYYGVMELSGNLWEQVVNAGFPSTTSVTTGFIGLQGDGKLTATGNADTSNWPQSISGQTSSAIGSGRKAGGWTSASTLLLTISTRSQAGASQGIRVSDYGGRGVRDCGGVSSNCSVDSSL